jgi:hypothetical protein
MELSAQSMYNENMDKKVYYDADRTHNDQLASMSEVLEKFITSEVNSTVIHNYQNGKLKLSQEELIMQANNVENKTNPAVNKVDTKKESGFFSSMMSKIGFAKEPSQEEQPNNVIEEKPGFFASMFEKIGIGSTKKLNVVENDVVEEEVTDENK